MPEQLFPKLLAVVIEDAGDPDQYFVAAKTPEELAPEVSEGQKPFATYQLVEYGIIETKISVVTEAD